MSTGSIYDRVVQHIFYSGNVAPGGKIVETKLATRLGVSRIPVRETLGRLAGQGLVVGDQDGHGLRMRKYTVDDIRQLYELRELLEGGAARGAANAATSADIARLEMICKQTESEVGNYGSTQWANLDHAFHSALADASHNERIADSLKVLLTESHYVFYLYPSHSGIPKPTKAVATARMQSVLKEHRALLSLIRAGNADGAERKARKDMQLSSQRITEALVKLDMGR